MEELFREAAEKYQVDTEKAEAWDDVYAALQGDEQPGPAAPGYKHNKRWLNLLWLLLIPLGWFAHNVWDDTQNNKTAKRQATEQKSNTAATTNNNNTGNSAVNDKAAVNSNSAATAGVNDKAANNGAQQAAGNGNTRTALVVARNSGFSTKGRGQIKTSGGNIGTTAGGDDNSKANGTIANNTPAVPVPQAAPPVTNAVPGSNTNAATPPPVATAPQSGNPVNAGTPANNSTAAITPPAITNSTAVNTPAEENKSKIGKDKKPAANSQHYLYAGMLASPDISFIHGQKSSPVGVSAGIIVGYAFNKHLSAETGILYDKKNYYTKGQYFDKDRIAWFKQHPDIKVIDVQGNCKMIEIPINVRYSFINKNKNSVYAVAGLSTYFMGRENYNYNLDDWGSQYPKATGYNNHIKNWFSIMNVGVGYERKIGTKTAFRIEPFIKLPVSGVGSGNINITSTGLYLGVTRRIP